MEKMSCTKKKEVCKDTPNCFVTCKDFEPGYKGTVDEAKLKDPKLQEFG